MRDVTIMDEREADVEKTIRVRITRGVLEPLEKLDLPEGREVTITILDVPSERDLEAFSRSFGGWKGLVDAEALLRNIRASRDLLTRPEPRL